MPRIYDVSAGEVRVDGHDVRDYTLESLRGAVGMVMQDPHLFHDTIRANLRYARPDATDAELVDACKAARIHDMIASLPDGYDTLVGERGYRMSGGEKQRLAIARMLLKDPAVVILDEATSHLDSESELAIQHALADALVGRTSLVIAHRLSTIVAADRILVLEDGRIIESGRHDELLRAGGLYTDLYQTQVDGTSPTRRPPTRGDTLPVMNRTTRRICALGALVCGGGRARGGDRGALEQLGAAARRVGARHRGAHGRVVRGDRARRRAPGRDGRSRWPPSSSPSRPS